MTAFISKGDLWGILGDKAFPVAMWICGTSIEQQATKLMWESLTELNLENSIFQQLFPLLLAAGVVDQACIDRISLTIAQINSPQNF